MPAKANETAESNVAPEANGRVCSSYDRIAEEYANHIFDELRHKPLDRELLNRFADRVKGRVYELGCGPGHVARYLHARGMDVAGIDLSPEMIEVARRLTPEVEFAVGDLRKLNLETGSCSGLVAFYAIVNLRPEELNLAVHEMGRVLRPGGLLLLSFHVGNEVEHVDDLWGQMVDLDFYFFSTEQVRSSMESAGLEIEEIIEREPYPPEVEYQSRRAYIFAGKARVKSIKA